MTYAIENQLTKQTAEVGQIMLILSDLLERLSGERLLTKHGHANGGTVVFVRAMLISCEVFILGLLVMNWVDPDRLRVVDLEQFRRDIVEHGKWFGGIFAGSYAALYARFSAQWTYLAGVYNQLKAAQCRSECNQDVMAQWRAGLIEDCDDLHLLRKPMFASICHGLLIMKGEGGDATRTCFDLHTAGGEARRRRIEADVLKVVEREARRYSVL
jgi:hypothetical protein